MTGKKIAVKMIAINQLNSPRTQNLTDKIDFEIKVMRELNHPNIVTYYDVLKTENIWYIVMEYCNHGTINDVIIFNNHNQNIILIVNKILITIWIN